jgi:Family of unknown function (DUF6134)
MRRAARMLAALGATLFTAGAFAAEQARVWDFRAFLDDAPIGYHRFTLSGEGAARELRSETRFEVKFLFVTAYRYVHDATERWRGNCLEGLSARTDDNGERLVVSAAGNAEGLVVTATAGREALPGCVMSFAYWNPQMLRQSRLLNAQTGKFEAAKIALLGEETITVRGAPLTAKRYRITGPKHPIDVWYAADDEWLALESIVGGGRRLRYSLN